MKGVKKSASRRACEKGCALEIGICQSFAQGFEVEITLKWYEDGNWTFQSDMVTKRVSIHHPLGFDWPPLEGAGTKTSVT